MTFKVTMTVMIKEEGLMAFFKNIIIKQVMNSAKDTTIENDMMKVNIDSIEQLK